MPPVLFEWFLEREHVMNHNEGLWNGIWSDMMIETTYMKFGKGPSGIIGQTTKPRTLQIWAKSQHACSEVLQSLDQIREKDRKTITAHKEENAGRIKTDQADKLKLRNFLQTCFYPFDVSNHPEAVSIAEKVDKDKDQETPKAICNIYTGQIAESTVNVDDSVEKGKKQMTEFLKTLPGGFRSTLSKTVTTKDKNKKNFKEQRYIKKCITLK